VAIRACHCPLVSLSQHRTIAKVLLSLTNVSASSSTVPATGPQKSGPSPRIPTTTGTPKPFVPSELGRLEMKSKKYKVHDSDTLITSLQPFLRSRKRGADARPDRPLRKFQLRLARRLRLPQEDRDRRPWRPGHARHGISPPHVGPRRQTATGLGAGRQEPRG